MTIVREKKKKMINSFECNAGIYKPSRGKIFILGRDYERVKNLIGYCPQDNILVNDLTAVEHVYIFGMVKS